MMSKTSKKTTPADKDSVLYLPPDGYSRFFVIISLLDTLYASADKPVRILDIGGCSPYLQELLDRSPIPFELTILDILPKPPEITATYIQGDATKSDLPDGSFDVVVSTDTLEHIPKNIKDDFVRGCVRLCKDVCILAAPFDTEGVNDGEHLVNDFNKQLFRVGQDWLEEHFEFGKPKLDQTRAVLDKLGPSYEHFGTNNLYSWIFSTHMNLIEAKIGMGRDGGTQANFTYNQALAKSVEFAQPTYRHFFVVYKNKQMASKKPLQTIIKPTDPQSFATYMHTMFGLVADRLTTLSQDADLAHEKAKELERSLQNELVHSQKLNEELVRANAELQRLAPLRRLARLRNPRHVANAVKRRVSKK